MIEIVPEIVQEPEAEPDPIEEVIEVLPEFIIEEEIFPLPQFIKDQTPT